LAIWLSRSLVCLGLLLASTAVLGQQPDVIAEIQVHGNRSVPADVVRAHVFTKPGDVYDQSAIERDFNSLWNTGFFEDIRFEREATPKGWIVHIYVKERPRIKTISYSGINAISKSDILERFKTEKVGLSPQSQYDPTKVKHAEVVIRQLEAEHGRQFATVRTEVRPLPPANVEVTFVVREGPKVKVGRIKFEGNRHISSRELRSAMHFLKPIGVPHSIFLENLFPFALALAAALLIYARGFARWPFGPAWWAFTFPLDALAYAAARYAQDHPEPLWRGLAGATLLLATFFVLAVLWRTLRSGASPRA